MAQEPQFKVRPTVKLEFDFGGLAGQDFGHLYKSFEFQGMVNGGYIIRATLFDTSYNLLTKLIEEGYFKETRTKPVPIKFQILAGVDGKFPETATRAGQTAIMLSIEAVGGPEDIAYIEFIAIDPPSWYLNMGDASGKVYKGRVDQVIRKVVGDYAPKVNVDVSKTTDSEHNKWWMMRQDPKTFIASFLDWSSSITQKKTHWLVESDGYNLNIKEQASITSKQRGFYRYFSNKDIDTISQFSLKADNALNVIQTKLVTAGLAAISGQYLDKITDVKEDKVFIKDSRTANKQIAKTDKDKSFTKPPDGKPSQVGWSQVSGVPEIYSAGDLGIPYDEYIDGRPRGLWLNMMNSLLRAKLTVLGHGEWSDCKGLGVDTVFLKWISAKAAEQDQFWWATGSWLIYGFHHTVTRGSWTTDLYVARFDYDSVAKKVGGNS